MAQTRPANPVRVTFQRLGGGLERHQRGRLWAIRPGAGILRSGTAVRIEEPEASARFEILPHGFLEEGDFPVTTLEAR